MEGEILVDFKQFCGTVSSTEIQLDIECR